MFEKVDPAIKNNTHDRLFCSQGLYLQKLLAWY
jgi:hypothetical protein